MKIEIEKTESGAHFKYCDESNWRNVGYSEINEFIDYYLDNLETNGDCEIIGEDNVENYKTLFSKLISEMNSEDFILAYKLAKERSSEAESIQDERD
ncbi:hypothetical protein H9L01_05395 [Erysipelothrix inopinata]|uniref:Uncharacterized protein n=1 Tax=Erysipelothrix inopinata TaxID=225084 RepID=A0A7G9RW53_9FIRM|nr:hypothetical protein [Erysipelothrix inopinata]QNN59828.1 hypothetical protein H9L01_05395 [Erysipelothrix inopinata]